MDDTQPLIAQPNPTGAVLTGRYRLEQLLGKGGVADVFRAHDELLKRQVAVKLFRGDASTLDDERRRQSEITVLASLNHPNLVAVYDAGLDSSVANAPQPFLVMELVAGITLADRIARATLTSREAASVGRQLAVALSYVHAQGVVHRDVKPANILLTDPELDADGEVTVKLTDFGIARLVDESRMTMQGLTVGTAQYLSPEQAMGSDAEPPSDIYSLGLVLLQSLTGEVAYPGRAVEAAAARLHRPPRIPPELGQHWTDLLAGMTDRDPQARPNATEVASRLRDGLSQPVDYRPPASAGNETAVFPFVDHPSAPVPQRQPSEPDPSSPKQRRRLRPLVLISALALALIAVLVILMLRPHSSATNRPTPPAYPSVSGQLGADLRDLQRSVQ